MNEQGYTLMHEHTTIDLSGVKMDEDCRLDCYDETLKEFKQLYSQGVRKIVDVTNIGMGRNPNYVAEIAKESGIEIILSTGFYKDPFLPEIVREKSVTELANLFINEIENGIDGVHKVGMIGEIGTSKNAMLPIEAKVLEAGSIASIQTKKPIYTHTTLGTYALEQVAFFEKHGVDLSKVIIGHVDLSGDLDYIRSILKTGVNVGFDTVGKNNYFPDEKRVEFLKALESDGYLSQVVLSMDLTRKSHLNYKGGIGYNYLIDTFLPMLRASGIKEEHIDKMLIDNPKRILY